MDLKFHGYQEVALNEIYESTGVIWVAEMGAGKSAVSLRAIRELIDTGEIDRAVVFAPLRVAQVTWIEENDKWGFGLRVETLAGKNAAKRNMVLNERSWNVLMVNYELAPWLEQTGFKADERVAVFFDEVTKLKSPTSKRRKAVRKITDGAASRVGLTGSPHANGRLDYWGIVDAVYPNAWGRSFYAWRAQHFRSVDPNGHVWKELPGCGEKIDADYAARCFKVDVPKFSEPVPVFDSVVLPPKVMKQYRELEKDMVATFGDDIEILALQQTTVGIKLRQVASGCVLDEMGEVVDVHSTKIDAVREIVEASGDNCLIVYQFKAEVDRLREIWPDMPVLGGGTSAKDAQSAMQAWNRGEVPVMALHTMSASHGLNLQAGGRRLIWLSLTYSQESHEQVNARLARQGQTRTVYVHYVTASETIDDKIARSLASKKQQQIKLMDAID